MAKQKKSSSKKSSRSKKSTKKTKSKTSKKKSSKPLKKIVSKAESEPKKEVKEVIEASIPLIDDNKNKQAVIVKEHKMPEKFWQKSVYSVLMDPTLVKSEDLVKYDLSSLLSEFTKKMLNEEMINFRISGMAIYSASKLHHRKIRDVIEEEEQIKIREMREKTRREIPRAMPQPLREPRKIATSEEMFEAMRAGIIETMQKREFLRRRRERQIAKREELKVIRAKGQLPIEILKHIMGKDKTVEEILQSWFETIRAKIKINDRKITSYNEICRDIIEIEEKDLYGQNIKSVEFFIALLFLSTNGKIIITQDQDFDDIQIEIPRYII